MNSSTASSPEPARPTTSMSPCRPISIDRPSRTMRWSSTQRTRMRTGAVRLLACALVHTGPRPRHACRDRPGCGSGPCRRPPRRARGCSPGRGRCSALRRARVEPLAAVGDLQLDAVARVAEHGAAPLAAWAWRTALVMASWPIRSTCSSAAGRTASRLADDFERERHPRPRGQLFAGCAQRVGQAEPIERRRTQGRESTAGLRARTARRRGAGRAAATGSAASVAPASAAIASQRSATPNRPCSSVS